MRKRFRKASSISHFSLVIGNSETAKPPRTAEIAKHKMSFELGA
jgi:hypothetical protein